MRQQQPPVAGRACYSTSCSRGHDHHGDGQIAEQKARDRRARGQQRPGGDQ